MLQNSQFARHSLVKILPPIADMISGRNGGGWGEQTQRKIMFHTERRARPSLKWEALSF